LGRRQGGGDEFGAHVVGDHPACQAPGGEVADRGQIHEPPAGQREIGDVADVLRVHRCGGEVSYQVVIETIAATTTRTGLTIDAELDTGSYRLGTTVTAAEFQALPITPDAFHGDWNYTMAPVPPRTPQTPATAQRIDPDLTTMLSNPALTGMPRSDFERLVAVSEPYWDALAEAAFQRRFHRPRSYLHPQTSSLDHYHRLLAALLRRRRAITSTLLAQLWALPAPTSPTSSKTGTGSWTCIASPLHRCLGRPPGPSNSFEFACLTRTIRKINPDSYSDTSPGRAGVLPLHARRSSALLEEAGLVDDQDTVGLTEPFGHVFLQVVADLIGIPPGPVQQVLQAGRNVVADVLRELPAVLPTDGAEQPAHVVPHPPPQIDPAEPVSHPQQHLFQLKSPAIRPHISLHDQHNSDHKPPVTNSRHMTTHQLSKLRNQPLTNGNSKVQLEY
jgi:hypothetical protein